MGEYATRLVHNIPQLKEEFKYPRLVWICRKTFIYLSIFLFIYSFIYLFIYLPSITILVTYTN